VRSGDKTLGVIQLLNSKLDLLSEYSISFLSILCDYAAIAIQNARSVKLIHELTITDDCTGLFNARHLYTMLDEQVALAASHRDPSSACSSSTSTTSKRSTTPTATWSAAACSPRWAA
jgi:GAF domain-containing protein